MSCTRQLMCRPFGPSRVLEIVSTTPLRTWLFHYGPSGLLHKLRFAYNNRSYFGQSYYQVKKLSLADAGDTHLFSALSNFLSASYSGTSSVVVSRRFFSLKPSTK